MTWCDTDAIGVVCVPIGVGLDKWREPTNATVPSKAAPKKKPATAPGMPNAAPPIIAPRMPPTAVAAVVMSICLV